MINRISGKTILLVDDEPDMADLLEEALISKGANVFKANDGLAAMNHLASVQFDLIVSDIRMPEMDGTKLLKEVRKKDKLHPPVIMVTGYADSPSEQVYDLGADGFLLKPFTIDSILQVVCETLSQPIERWQRFDAPISNALNIERAHEKLEDLFSSSYVKFGRGGFFLKLDKSLPNVDEVAEFTFKGPRSEESLTGLAICRWIRETETQELARGAGFEFCFIPESSRPCLEKVYQRVKNHSYIPNNLDRSNI